MPEKMFNITHCHRSACSFLKLTPTLYPAELSLAKVTSFFISCSPTKHLSIWVVQMLELSFHIESITQCYKKDLYFFSLNYEGFSSLLLPFTHLNGASFYSLQFSTLSLLPSFALLYFGTFPIGPICSWKVFFLQ